MAPNIMTSLRHEFASSVWHSSKTQQFALPTDNQNHITADSSTLPFFL
jgi:hypothetical protein